MARRGRRSRSRQNRSGKSTSTSSKGKSSSSSSSSGGGGSSGSSGGSGGGGKGGGNSGSGGNKGRKTTGKGMGPRGKLSSPQSVANRARFKAREAAGLSGLTGGPKGTGLAGRKGSTISIYRANQKKQVQDAARIRNASFKAERDVKSGQVPGQGGAMSPAAREAAAKQLAAKRAEIAAEATRKSTFDPGRLKGGILTQASAAFADTFAKPKYMYQGNFAGRIPGLSNYFSPDAGAAATYSRSGALKGIPFAGGSASGTLTRFNVPDGAKIGRSPLGIRQFKLNPKQMSQLGKGITVAGDDVAKVAAKGLGKYGARAVPFVGAGLSLADSFNRVREGDYTGAALAAGSAIPGPVGWASLAGLAAKDISTAMNNREAQTASVDAGGLNIGSTGGVDSGEATSNTGRTVVTTNKDKNISYDVGGIARDVGLGLADAATFNKFDFDNLGRPGDDKSFTQKFETFKKSPLQQAIVSKQTGIDAKRIINEGEDAAKSLFSNYIGNIDASSKKGIRQPIAKFLKDVGSDDATAMAGRAIDAYGYNDPNFSDDPNKLTKMLKFTGLPQLSQENVQDLRHTFNKDVTEPTGIQGKSMLKNVPYTQALGFANRIVSGKLSDATGEAMTQLGMGNVGSIDDAVNLGMQINTNKQTEGTVANQRFGELNNLIQKYGPGKGQIPTLPSIIKGIGGAVNRTGASGNTMQIQGGNNMTATLPANQQVAQLLPLPTTATQTGTNSGNLANMMQNAYASQMSLYGMNPNYFANIMQPRFNTRPRRFRQVFNRDYY